MSKTKNNIIKSIVLSLFNDDGPTPIIYWPETMDESSRLLIAMKTISLLMGDTVYQNGDTTDDVNYFGILPFPDLKLNGLTYFFLIMDPTARGNAKAATITILIDEDDRVFFYENMKYLRVIIDSTATKVQMAKTLEDNKTVMNDLKEKLFEFTSEIKDPFSLKRQIKILMTGLDRAGKTSFLHAVKKRYSEIIKTLPTKGIARSEEKIFEEISSSVISVWDLGGQKTYREKFLEQRKIYLFNVDLLFYFIDVQDISRMNESIELFSKVIGSLIELEEFPPIVVCLNKYDPDLRDLADIRSSIKKLVERINEISEQFFIKIFETSIFDGFSLISAYSYGLSQLSPNRELFENQLKHFAKKINSDAILLLNENGIILSNFSQLGVSEKLFEISAPHFQTLYKTFKEFKLLKQDFLVSSGITDESKKIIFKRIAVEKHNLYLLLFMEKELNLDKIEKHLPKLSKNLSDLIQTYI
ncbi:MAG: ADP-ribosylation factor-like protein [Promethearchaeota archaeon]